MYEINKLRYIVTEAVSETLIELIHFGISSIIHIWIEDNGNMILIKNTKTEYLATIRIDITNQNISKTSLLNLITYTIFNLL